MLQHEITCSQKENEKTDEEDPLQQKEKERK